MNDLEQYSKWIGTGILLAMTAGAPAVADDTELLLAQPPISKANQPNLLFILDTSGSMRSEENTIEPYDSTKKYSGECERDEIYWTEVDIVPDCDSDGIQFTDEDEFFCDAALTQMAGLGTYAGVMAQFRDGGRLGDDSDDTRKSWQFLAADYEDAPLECETDSGVHGDGRPDYLWASVGNSRADPFTRDPTQEVSWGSAPRNASYFFYDGNYINWKNSPNIVTLSRMDIVKKVVSTVLKTITGVNVGIMRFNKNMGGPVIHAITDLEVGRASALAKIDRLTGSGATPVSETLYEAALYWRGMNAKYGEEINKYPTDPAALDSTNPENYKQPVTSSCSKNYNILLTDGGPNLDHDTPDLAPTLPNYAAALGRTNCDGKVEEGMCLDDISEYLSKVDIDSVLDGDQFVTTHTIGYAVDLEILRRTAEDSGGSYFLADDIESLASTLMKIITTISNRNLSFAAPAVPVNSFNRTQNMNDLYLTAFKPRAKAHWPGNLKKYRLVDGVISDANGEAAVDPATGFFKDTAKSYWTTGVADGGDVLLGGAARQLPNPARRSLYTNNSGVDLTAVNNQLTPSNAGAFSDADFGLSGAKGEPSIAEIIRWARGEDLLDEDEDPATTVRHAMGDPLHSQPATVIYGGTEANPDVVVFIATNDGYLHAIDGSTGAELWSFVPKALLPRFARLYFDLDSKYKQYGIDGSVVSVVKDENDNGIIDGSDFIYLLFGMRRGGFEYYALDVTKKNSPKLLWNVTYPEMGESWPTPIVTRINIDTGRTNADKAVVVLGGGYDTIHDTATYPSTAADAVGNGIHILDLKTGARLWRAGNDAGADLQLAGMTRAIASQVRVIDLSGDGFADRLYAADLGGQLLRFDLRNGETPANLATGGVIAQLGAEGLATPGFADTRRFFTAPDVSLITDRTKNKRFISLSIGSGYRAHPLDESATDRFFSVRDPDVFNQLTQAEYDRYNIVRDGDLVEVSGSVRTIIDSTKRGWKFTLPANQKVLSDSLTFDDTVTFVGFSPEVNQSEDCAPSMGKNFLYRVSVENGDPVVNNLDTLDPADADDERMEELAQGGIAPAPTILFPGPDDPNCTGTDCAPPPISCVGAECRNPGFDNIPVRTLWTQSDIE